MSDVLSEDELKVLAAEYVLGTLDYEERNGASALLEVDPVFRGIVRVWEKRFGELHLMVESVDPDLKVWERIRPKISGVEQIPPAIPSAAAEPAAPVTPGESSPPLAGEAAPAATSAEPAPAATSAEPAEEKAVSESDLKLAELAALLPVAEQAGSAATAADPTTTPAPTNEDLLGRPAEQVPRGFVPPAPMVRRSPPPEARRGGRGWMAATAAMSLVVVGLALLISAWRFFPERLPEPLQAYSVLNLPVPPPPAPPPPAPPPPFAE